MRPNRLELCITCPGDPWSSCRQLQLLPGSQAPKPQSQRYCRHPWALLCYRQRGASWDLGWFLWLWGPQNGKKRKNLCWKPHVGDSQMPPIVTSSQKRSNTCLRGFLWCIATNSVSPQLVPFLETVRTVIRANTIVSSPMAVLCYSKTFIDEVMPSPFGGRARSCPPIMTFGCWIRPSMASCFSFCWIFCGMLRLVWCMKMSGVNWGQKLKNQTHSTFASFRVKKCNWRCRRVAAWDWHKPPFQHTVSIYGQGTILLRSMFGAPMYKSQWLVFQNAFWNLKWYHIHSYP